MAGYRVAVVGATGAVGKTILKVLAERKFPVRSLNLFATSRSAGTTIEFNGTPVEVREIALGEIKGADFAFFCAASQASKELAPALAAAGTIVIDKSSVFRMDPAVPLVVPEVNPGRIRSHRGIIASPNCSTIQLVVAIKPVYDMSRITRLIVSSYQSVSGTGHDAVDELAVQTRVVLDGGRAEPRVYPRQIAFNALPHIDAFEESGYTGEEMKLVRETRKILEDDQMRITATTVRVPVFYGHSEAVTLETSRPLGVPDVIERFSRAPGVVVSADPADYHTAVECAGRDEVFVSRIRKDIAFDNGISMWVVSDNLRKGAATNAVQIAEMITGA
ncbi:MAG: aspartate-semialdehyde dehydrogenase [Firmicutes bacterium]|nr:aspartate-semialdehyde dehydrogenase [Bacillota bacterium]